jgi:hypothetical protein
MDIDTMVESHFKKNRDVFGFESIAQLIEEVMDSMESAGVPLAEGGSPSELITEAKGFSAAAFFDSIFTPNMTEAVGEIGTPERDAFLKIMKKIQGDTLEAKLDSVRAFIAGDDAQTDKADKVLSYLVFLKTMAEVFQQYSPSGSGFLLEAFLAGLMKGKQIVDTEEGSLPIVDYTTEGGDPVSLKRLTGGEKKTPIKGSIKNLSAHIAQNPARGVDYVIAAIHGAKDGGTIEFTQFTINAESYIKYIGKYLKVPPGTSFTKAAGPTSAADNLEANVFQEERGLQEVESTADIRARVAKNYPHRVGEIQKALGVNGTEKNPVIAGKNEETGQEMPALKATTKPMEQLAKADPGGIAKAASVLVSKAKFLPELVNTKVGAAGADGFNAVFRDAQGKLQRHWIAANSKEDALGKIKEALPDVDLQKARFYGKPGASNIEQALQTLIDFPERGLADQKPEGSYLYPHKSSGPGKVTPAGTPREMTILGAMTLLQSAFKEAVGNLPTAGSYFSHGAMSHSQGSGGTGVGAESLAQMPADQQAAFPAWLTENPKKFMALVNYSIGRAPSTLPSAKDQKDKKQEKAQTLQEMIDQMLVESKEEMLLVEGDEKKDKTQFLISQQQARNGTPGAIGTIDITRKHLLDVADKYNAVVKERLSPIFISVDSLMAALQSFYVNNRVASGEKASDECEALKGNVDAEVSAAKATRKK